MTDDVIARRRAALLAVGLDPTDMAPGVVEDRAPPAPQLQSPPPTLNEPERFGLPVEVARPLSDAAWMIVAPFMKDRPGAVHTRRRIIDAMLRHIVGGEPWSSIGGIRSGFYSAVRASRGRDYWRAARDAAAIAFTDATERDQFARVCNYMLTGDIRLLSERPGLKRYQAKLAAEARRRAGIEATDKRADDTKPPRRSRLDVPFHAR